MKIDVAVGIGVWNAISSKAIDVRANFCTLLN